MFGIVVKESYGYLNYSLTIIVFDDTVWKYYIYLTFQLEHIHD